MTYEEDDESFEHTLLVVREVSRLIKFPLVLLQAAYKCEEWFTIRQDLVRPDFESESCKDRCEIRLEDPNSVDLFAACFVNPGQRDEHGRVQSLDSSRIFRT
ncbi:hypothetical protein NC652_012380 [Populus alba x Populus x berolinensis]|nr:hypothetical protein NC652_012380 [Populus alba x Populus x berolinensis]